MAIFVKSALLNWRDMEGDNTTIKKLNSLLTIEFSHGVDVLSDECLTEASYIYYNLEELDEVADYLNQKYGVRFSEEFCEDVACSILELLR